MSLPNVMLIGDSIRIGYKPYVATYLSGLANIYEIPQNGQTTLRTKQGLMDGWLAGRRYDMICFNNGLHDSATDGGISTTQYHDYLEDNIAIMRSQQAGALLSFMKTTYIGAAASPTRTEVLLTSYNDAITDVWTANTDIQLLDLHTPTETNYATWGSGDGVHYYGDPGYTGIAALVATHIATRLGLAYP